MKQPAIIAVISLFVVPIAFGQGSLTPPGAPAPIMKSLDQIEARTPISSAPFTISQPGSYYLTTNVSVTVGDAIIINTNNVTLDLNGFTISSTAPSAAGYAVELAVQTGNSDITVFNGHIKSGVTNNGPLLSGGGFGSGIDLPGINCQNVRVTGVSIVGCLNYGIYLSESGGTIVDSCAIQSCGYGITAQIVTRSSASQCLSGGIVASIVTDSWASVVTNAIAVKAFDAANHCSGLAIGSGTGVAAGVAIGCTGYAGNNGFGISATVAQACFGSTGGGGHGISANVTNACFGTP